MASYGCDYISDFGKVYRSVKLYSRLYTSDGTKSRTTREYDRPFLPSVFESTVDTTSKCRSCCSLIIKPRAVKLWLDESKYLYLQHPFAPTTADYETFMSQIADNDQILYSERIGEKLDDFYTNLLT